ncbi:MAG: ABC transporter permease [Bacillota bacterium]
MPSSTRAFGSAEALAEKSREAAPDTLLQAAGARRRLWGGAARLFADWATLTGVVLVGLFVVSAAFAPLFARFDPNQMHFDDASQPPGARYWFGTDWAGRDIYSRVVYGGRVSLAVSFISGFIALLIGVPLGLAAGYYGGVLDEMIMRLVDTIYSFPFIVLAIAAMAFLGQSLWNVMLVLGIVSWVDYARIVRAEVLSVRAEPYIEAARALGLADGRILWRHVLPNVVGPVVVYVTLNIPQYIIAEAALSFLGLGAQPDLVTWGNILNRGREAVMRGEWWVTAFPGLAISLTVVGFNLLGDGLRDLLLRRRTARNV